MSLQLVPPQDARRTPRQRLLLVAVTGAAAGVVGAVAWVVSGHWEWGLIPAVSAMFVWDVRDRPNVLWGKGPGPKEGAEE